MKKFGHHTNGENIQRGLLIIVFSLCISGCTTTILDKHNAGMKATPNRIHYATAVPFGAYKHMGAHPSKDAAYRSACIHYQSYPSYQRKAEWPYEWFSGAGGGSQDEIESYVVRECESRYNRTCIVILYNNTDRCAATFESAYAREQSRVKQRQDEARLAVEENTRRKSEEMSRTCISFGFKPNTPELSSCMLEMHKSLAQIEAIRNASSRQASAIEAANAEAVKLREFEQGMMLLQGSSNLLNSMQPNRSSVKCRYNTIMKTITCD